MKQYIYMHAYTKVYQLNLYTPIHLPQYIYLRKSFLPGYSTIVLETRICTRPYTLHTHLNVETGARRYIANKCVRYSFIRITESHIKSGYLRFYHMSPIYIQFTSIANNCVVDFGNYFKQKTFKFV